jgi:hypothetical protein
MPVLQTLGAEGVVLAGVGLFMSLFLIVGLFLSIFWIWMLIDCITSRLPSMDKLIWFLVILFLHVLGAALYYVIARPGTRTGVV